MAQVVSEQLILVDADGHVTEDRERAVRGEVVRRYDDGSEQNTLFELSADRDRR